jgi:ATP-dependent DNA ligase
MGTGTHSGENEGMHLWLKPEAVAQIEFLEWTGANYLRHRKFIALRDDEDPRKVVKEA